VVLFKSPHLNTTMADWTLELIDRLIVKAIENGNSKFEDMFSYVAKNFEGPHPNPFVRIVDRRHLALRSRGVVFFDRSENSWKVRDKELIAS
jgi:hypothetical protein